MTSDQMKDAATEIHAAANALMAHLAKKRIKATPQFFAVRKPMTAGPSGPLRFSFADAFNDAKQMPGPAGVAFMLARDASSPPFAPQDVAGWDVAYRNRFEALQRALAEKIDAAQPGGATE